LAVRLAGPSGPLDPDLQRELVNREVASKGIAERGIDWVGHDLEAPLGQLDNTPIKKQDGEWVPDIGKFRKQAVKEVESQTGRLQAKKRLLRELDDKAKTLDEVCPQLRAFERKARRLLSVQLNRLRQGISDPIDREKAELKLSDLYLAAFDKAIRYVERQL